jgi:hypothetical protein
MVREKKDVAALGIRIDVGVKEALDRAAQDDRRSTASYVEKVLADHLAERGYLKAPKRPK